MGDEVLHRVNMNSDPAAIRNNGPQILSVVADSASLALTAGTVTAVIVKAKVSKDTGKHHKK